MKTICLIYNYVKHSTIKTWIVLNLLRIINEHFANNSWINLVNICLCMFVNINERFWTSFKDRLNKYWYDNSVLKLVETRSTDDLKKVRYWIDCGDDDFLTKGNCLLHLALRDKKVPHEFRVRDGSHSWTYWRTGITDALQFIGESFHQK